MKTMLLLATTLLLLSLLVMPATAYPSFSREVGAYQSPTGPAAFGGLWFKVVVIPLYIVGVGCVWGIGIWFSSLVHLW